MTGEERKANPKKKKKQKKKKKATNILPPGEIRKRGCAGGPQKENTEDRGEENMHPSRREIEFH